MKAGDQSFDGIMVLGFLLEGGGTMTKMRPSKEPKKRNCYPGSL